MIEPFTTFSSKKKEIYTEAATDWKAPKFDAGAWPTTNS